MISDRSRRIALLRRWTRLMDSAYQVPGTKVRFGWDPIIGLVPGVGDVATSAFAAAILYHACRLGVPRIVIIRMVINILIDLLAGLIPFAGDVADFAWKSNTLNLALIERHERPGVRPTSGDWAVVLLACTLVGVVVAMVLLAAATMGYTALRPFL